MTFLFRALLGKSSSLSVVGLFGKIAMMLSLMCVIKILVLLRMMRWRGLVNFLLDMEQTLLANTHCLFLVGHPPAGFFKLNTDGASCGNPGRASAGGVFRDGNGRWVLGFGINLGTSTSVLAELWGLKHGLLIAKNRELKPLIVEMDALLVRNMINNGVSETHQFHGIVADCRELLTLMEERKVDHTIREGNCSTDFMAKFALDFEATFDPLLFEEHPQGICNILFKDQMGGYHSRDDCIRYLY